MMNHFFLPFRGVFCRVSPIAFDGTLSFLELVCKLQHYVNELADNLNSLETALEEFEAYVETALEGKQDVLTWDSTPTDGSLNPVTSDGIYDALTLKQDLLIWDTTPTNGSTNPVTSDGIYDALALKQDTLTFDFTPTDDSTNPVTSDGIKSAIDAVYNRMTWQFPATISNGTVSVVGVTFANLYSRLNNNHQNLVIEATITQGNVETHVFFYTTSWNSSQIRFVSNVDRQGSSTGLHITVDSSDNWTYSN